MSTNRRCSWLCPAVFGIALTIYLLPEDLKSQRTRVWQDLPSAPSVDTFLLPGSVSPLSGSINPSLLFFSSPAIGYYGKRLRTLDSGRSWEVLDYDMVAPHWMTGDSLVTVAPVPTSPQLALFSDDSGRTWTPLAAQIDSIDVQISNAVVGASGCIAGMYDVVSAGKKIAYTFDGGRAWHHSTNPFLNAIDTTGLLVQSSSYYQPVGFDSSALHALWYMSGRIRTPDGDVFWGYYHVRIPANGSGWTGSRFTEMASFVRTLWCSVECVAVLGMRAGSPNTPAIWSSRDSGMSWTVADLPAWLVTDDLRFCTARFGISSNGRTTDGGADWINVTPPFETTKFFAADSSVYYVAAPPSFFAGTTDAGNTWVANRPATPITAANVVHGRGVVGRRFRSVLRSSDSGATWVEVSDANDLFARTTRVEAISFVPAIVDSTIIAVDWIAPHDSTPSLCVIRSIDAGQTWTLQANLGIPRAPDDTVVLVRFPAGGMPDSLHGFLFHHDNMSATDDGGLHWSEGNKLPFRVQACEAVDSERLVATQVRDDQGVGGIWTSEDGGHSWIRVFRTTFPRSDIVWLYARGNSFRAIAPDPNQAYKKWDLLASDDFGTTVSRSECGGPDILKGTVLWRDTLRALLINGALSESKDGGRTWERIISDVSGYPVLDGNTLYVFGTGVGSRIALGEITSSVSRLEPSGVQSITVPRILLPVRERRVPTSGVNGDDSRCTLFDALGRKLATWRTRGTSDGNVLIIPESVQLPSGMYVLTVNDIVVAQFLVPE